MRVPPRWIRRVILAPAVIVLAAVLITVSPLWLLIALVLTSLVPGHLRLPRIVLLVLVYVVWDATVLLVMFVLWCASGFGWKIRTPAFIRAHYRVGRFALDLLMRILAVILRLHVTTAGDDGDDPAQARAAFNRLFAHGTPLVVASRHGGPGDSFIIMQVLLKQVRRQPRIVLKDTLQWDPGIDVLLSRVPTSFITPSGFGTRRARGSRGAVQAIGDLAHGLAGDDALVIFPEGGQVSESRRVRRTARLRASGNETLAERAERLRHVMPPQPGGVNAALEGAPDADMVFIGHTGLDGLTTIGDIWRELPMDKRLTMRAWRVPRDEIPVDRDEQADWLFSWFERIDQWITDSTPAHDGHGGRHPKRHAGGEPQSGAPRTQ